ncbi:hypothetical protein [Bradyrhizobium genosp. P]|uniref:hypothetical protein n=1 Tax=Bradyrhizobium genosp. P TaxID=83641 RepID=UPI003CE8A2EE
MMYMRESLAWLLYAQLRQRLAGPIASFDSLGASSLELIEAMKRVARSKPVVRSGPRRTGDPVKLVAAFAKTERDFGWRPQDSGTDFIIETALEWRNRHPPV